MKDVAWKNSPTSQVMQVPSQDTPGATKSNLKAHLRLAYRKIWMISFSRISFSANWKDLKKARLVF